jgi:hypothetical protein
VAKGQGGRWGDVECLHEEVVGDWWMLWPVEDKSVLGKGT